MRCFDAVLMRHPTNLVALLGKVRTQCTFTPQGSHLVRPASCLHGNNMASHYVCSKTFSGITLIAFRTLVLVSVSASGTWIKRTRQSWRGSEALKW